jgi:hypothetical protein
MRVFDNTILRRIFGPKMDEVTGDWRKLHNEELHKLNSSPNIIRQIKSRIMRWEGHVAHMREESKVYKTLEGNRKERDDLKNRRVGGSMGLEWILEKLVWGWSG